MAVLENGRHRAEGAGSTERRTETEVARDELNVLVDDCEFERLCGDVGVATT